MSSLIHCIYASRATAPLDDPQLTALLDGTRASNARCGVTGMLLFVEGNFFQVLEGEQATVEQVYLRICRDQRHCRVTRIIQEPIAGRSFADWTMGFARLAAGEMAGYAGINDFFTEATCLEQLEPGRARKLLQAFGRGRWRAGDTGMHRAHARLG